MSKNNAVSVSSNDKFTYKKFKKKISIEMHSSGSRISVSKY